MNTSSLSTERPPLLRVGRPPRSALLQVQAACSTSLDLFPNQQVSGFKSPGCPSYWFIFCKLSHSLKSAIDELVRILGSHPSDPCSHPNRASSLQGLHDASLPRESAQIRRPKASPSQRCSALRLAAVANALGCLLRGTLLQHPRAPRLKFVSFATDSKK